MIQRKIKESQRQSELRPVKSENKKMQRIIFQRVQKASVSRADRADLILAMNKVLTAQGLLLFVWVLNAGYSMAGAVSALLREGAVSTMLVPKYSDVLLTAVRAVDPEITAVETSEQ